MQQVWKACFEKGLVDQPWPKNSKDKKLRNFKKRQQKKEKQKRIRKKKEALGML